MHGPSLWGRFGESEAIVRVRVWAGVGYPLQGWSDEAAWALSRSSPRCSDGVRPVVTVDGVGIAPALAENGSQLRQHRLWLESSLVSVDSGGSLSLSPCRLGVKHQVTTLFFFLFFGSTIKRKKGNLFYVCMFLIFSWFGHSVPRRPRDHKMCWTSSCSLRILCSTVAYQERYLFDLCAFWPLGSNSNKSFEGVKTKSYLEQEYEYIPLNELKQNKVLCGTGIWT